MTQPEVGAPLAGALSGGQVSQPEQTESQTHISQPLPVGAPLAQPVRGAGNHPLPGGQVSLRFPKVSIFILLVLIGLLILSSASLLVFSLAQGTTNTTTASTATVTPAQQRTGVINHTPTTLPTTTANPNATPTPTPPIFTPGNTVIPPLQLPTGHNVIYEQQNNLYWIPSTGGLPQVLTTPGYIYNQAVRPILTPSGQLLYSGDGIYLADIFNGTTTQVATLAPNQVITSMVLSSDGTTIAWSTEPASGDGNIDIYAGPLASPVKVFEQSSTACPCFRIFAFMNGTAKQANTTLLLTDDQQSHESIQFGLWALDITHPLSDTLPPSPPQPLMDENSQQGPLALAPSSNVLLYSSYEGEVPMPTDGSVPDDLAVLKYANSLDVTIVDGHPLGLDTSQVILSEQHELANSAAYHWVTTPVFTPDGHTLIYVEFSTQSQAPYDRSSALFEAQITGSGKHLHVSKPQLMATSTAALLELGPWFNNHILTFYGDGALYALDIQSGAVTTIAQTGAYARIVAVVGLGGV